MIRKPSIMLSNYEEHEVRGFPAMQVKLYLNKHAIKAYDKDGITIYDVKDGYDGKVYCIRKRAGIVSGVTRVIMRAVEPKTRAELDAIIQPIKPVVVI